MQINLVGLKLGIAQAFEYKVPAKSLEADSPSYDFLGDVKVTGNVTFLGDDYRVEGEIYSTKHFSCDRCLVESTKEQVIPFSEDFSPEDLADKSIDLRDLVRDVLVSSQSLLNLCKDDCKGLCSRCGENLNLRECGCDRLVVDPRLAVLQDLFPTK